MNDGNKQRPDGIVLGGCGSTGTTLVHSWICRHPLVGGGPETNLLNHPTILDAPPSAWRKAIRGYLPSGGFMPCWRVVGKRDRFDVTRDVMEEWAATIDPAARVRQMLNHYARYFGCDVYADKTPTNVYSFESLAKILPRLPLVHCVRHPLDVVASLKRRGFSTFAAASRWLYDTACGLRVSGEPQYIGVRYEDFVADPVQAVSRIWERCGLPGADPMNARSSKEPAEVSTWKQRPHGPVSSSSIGTFQEELDTRDIAIAASIQLRGFPEMNLTMPRLASRLGYEWPNTPQQTARGARLQAAINSTGRMASSLLLTRKPLFPVTQVRSEL